MIGEHDMASVKNQEIKADIQPDEKTAASMSRRYTGLKEHVYTGACTGRSEKSYILQKSRTGT